MEKKDKEKKGKSEKSQIVELRLASPQSRPSAVSRKVQFKLQAMKIAQTHIEIQELKVDEKGACKSADKFLAWLKK